MNNNIRAVQPMDPKGLMPEGYTLGTLIRELAEKDPAVGQAYLSGEMSPGLDIEDFDDIEIVYIAPSEVRNWDLVEFYIDLM